MSRELSGRVAIVTGAARGIGRAIAEALLAVGAIVHGFDRLEVSGLNVRRYRHRQLDVGDARELEAAITDVVADAGRLDALVNNAGTHPPTQPIDSFSVEEFDELVRINLRSVFVACRAGLPALRVRGGAIVNIASAVGLHGQDGAVAYCATKAGVIGLTKALAIDEAPNRVRVNAVCPGAILTPLAEATHSPETLEKIAQWAWAERWGTPEEVAQLVLFLVGGGSSYITGESIVISGGAELGYGFKGRHYYREMDASERLAPAKATPGRGRRQQRDKMQ